MKSELSEIKENLPYVEIIKKMDFIGGVELGVSIYSYLQTEIIYDHFRLVKIDETPYIIGCRGGRGWQREYSKEYEYSTYRDGQYDLFKMKDGNHLCCKMVAGGFVNFRANRSLNYIHTYGVHFVDYHCWCQKKGFKNRQGKKSDIEIIMFAYGASPTCSFECHESSAVFDWVICDMNFRPIIKCDADDNVLEWGYSMLGDVKCEKSSKKELNDTRYIYTPKYSINHCNYDNPCKLKLFRGSMPHAFEDYIILNNEGEYYGNIIQTLISLRKLNVWTVTDLYFPEFPETVIFFNSELSGIIYNHETFRMSQYLMIADSKTKYFFTVKSMRDNIESDDTSPRLYQINIIDVNNNEEKVIFTNLSRNSILQLLRRKGLSLYRDYGSTDTISSYKIHIHKKIDPDLYKHISYLEVEKNFMDASKVAIIKPNYCLYKSSEFEYEFDEEIIDRDNSSDDGIWYDDPWDGNPGNYWNID